MDKHYVICKCMSPEHVVHFTYDQEERELFVEVYLNQYHSLWQRIIIAVKYIFGYKCKYGHFDCTLMSELEMEKLRAFLDLQKNQG